MTLTTSYAKGATSPPLLEHTIGAALRQAAARWPDQEAIVSRHQGVRLTWREFLARAEDVAAGLLALGLQPGERVGVWAPNCVEWALAQFATALVGLIQVNINPAYRVSEVEYTLKKVGVKALICADQFKSSDYVGMIEALAPEIAACEAGRLSAPGLPELTAVVQIGGDPRAGWLPFEDLARLGGEAERRRIAEIESTLDQGDAINIQFTSGTTGLPKGATLSHRNILNNAYFVGLSMGLRPGDRLCVPVPLYHCFGMVMSNLACCVHGGTMVYPSAGFDPLAVLEAVEAERCTALHGVPTMFIAELEHPEFERFDLSSLRTGIMAGAPCPIEVMRKVPSMTRSSVASRPSAASSRTWRSRSSTRRAAPRRWASRASSAPAAIRLCWATGTMRRRPPRRSTPRAGCTPATSQSWTRTATPTSSDASRTW